jgi:predicted esterase
MLHGRGGSAADMFALADAVTLPDVALAAPEAPGNSWWPTSFLAPSHQIEHHVERGLAAVRAAVAALQDGGLMRSRIWLMGFSQGACLALEAFAREGTGLGGVIALSGGLVGTGDDQIGTTDKLYGYGPKLFAYQSDLEGGDVWLSCHEKDPHIPLKRVEDSEKVLKRLGAHVTSKIYRGAGHGIGEADVAAIRARLNG